MNIKRRGFYRISRSGSLFFVLGGTAEGDAVQWYLKQAGDIPLLTKKEETALAYLVQEGDQQARQKLICSNLKLVISQAKKYMACTQSMTLPDLIQEGKSGVDKSGGKI